MVVYMVLSVFRVKFILMFPATTAKDLFFDLFVILFSFSIL